MSRTENLKYLDVPVFMLVTVLVLFGTIMIGSANGWVYSSERFTLDSLMIKQLIGYGLGLFVIVLIMICDYSFLKLMAVPAYCAVLVLLLLVLKYGVGAEENDNVSRWLPLFGDINIQPSELCKISLTLMLAWFFFCYQNSINRIHVLFFALVLSLIPLYLVFKEPDLSTSMVLLAIVGSSLFSTRLSWKYIIPGVTSDQAIMFLPAEALFAEINAYHSDLVEYAHKKRVWICSPTTLISTFTIIEVLLKNMERDKYASIIHDELNKLGVEFSRYKDRWDKLSRSIETVNKDIESIHVTTDKISKRFDSISKVEIKDRDMIE